MRITVGTSPTQLDSSAVNFSEIIALRNASGSIYLGGSNVTAATAAATDGWPYLATDEPMAFRVPEAGLWAVTASGSATVEVLRL